MSPFEPEFEPAVPMDASPPESEPESEPEPCPKPGFPWTLALGLFAASVVGSALVVPYSISLLSQAESFNVPRNLIPVVMVLSVAVESVVSAGTIMVGLWLGGNIGLGRSMLAGLDDGPHDRRRARNALALAVGLGLLLGVVIVVTMAATEDLIPDGIADVKAPPVWEGFLASIGAGIREEVWLRLGCLTLVAWIGTRLARRSTPGAAVLWSANLFAALLFGAIHLPQAAQLVGLTAPVLVVVLVGNGLPGLVFGWLYWRKGLVSAMVAHITMDVVLKVIAPLIIYE
jgi:hypothetical protein